MLTTFGKNQGGGYDTGCQFKTTLNNSSMGPLARSLNYTSLVDAFHGHAHRRLCQLTHLATYQTDLGVEDLGMCECAFSKSNAMGPVTRGMSVFHRQQEIDGYFRYVDDMETYRNISKCPLPLLAIHLTKLVSTATFIHNNYVQSLSILKKSNPILARLMIDLGVDKPEVFDSWLEEERQYLQELKREPPLKTLHMEYYQKLVNYMASRCVPVACLPILYANNS